MKDWAEVLKVETEQAAGITQVVRQLVARITIGEISQYHAFLELDSYYNNDKVLAWMYLAIEVEKLQRQQEINDRTRQVTLEIESA